LIHFTGISLGSIVFVWGKLWYPARLWWPFLFQMTALL
jgi:hypothetical protein